MEPKIGIGISDFEEIIKKGYYFIDKTGYIKDIIDTASKVILITRPRRFGKTLNMSMLRYYFDVDYKENAEIFKGLKIMEQDEKYTNEMGKYPCIYLTLKGINSATYEGMIKLIKATIVEVYIKHMNILESDKIYEFEKNKIMDILYERADEETLKLSIKNLGRYLYRIYGEKVYILIDEYDVPLQNAYISGYYDQAIEFLRGFYTESMKDNEYAEKVILTGVSRISKESIFSGLNNLKVCTILDDKFSDDFGITEEELEETIKIFKVEEQKEEIEKWYDGYVIGNKKHMYNPWSVLNYLDEKKLQPYWVNTSSNDIIKQILVNSTTVKEKIERLLKDEEIEVTINTDTILVGIENNEDNIWGLLLGTGYLKVVERVAINRYKVAIPNYEIKYLFEEIIERWFLNKVIGNDLHSILKDLITLNLSEFEKKFQILVREMFSYMDVGINTAENFYHAFVLGMLVGLKDTYYIKSNRESGRGRYDICLEPKDKTANSFIMEFKVYRQDTEESIEDTIENAKKQIEEKGYTHELIERGYTNITKMVVAFKGKEVKMEFYK